jgi:tryptophanyl-tRNA synthetase
MEGKTASTSNERNIMEELEEDNIKLVEQFGAKKITELKELPEIQAFRSGLIYSHRDFDVFYKNLLGGAKSAIVSGLNANSTSLHIGHMAVFDVNKALQEKYKLNLFAPLSDDESYVTGKINNQEEGLRNALFLTKSLIGYGFDIYRTKTIIDQIYTNIYNLAFKLSRNVTMSTIKAVYNYTDSDNVGLNFYPAVQSAHVLFPQALGYKNVLVPISCDEDAHLRVSRDVANKYGFEKVAVIHSRFLPGIDGKKMSKSKGNSIFFTDTEKEIKRKIGMAFSGGRTSIEEHRRLGGIPEADVAYLYLKYIFMSAGESKELYEEYRKGKLLTGELKQILFEKVMKRVEEFNARYNKVTAKDMAKVILANEDVDVIAIIEKLGIA